MKANWGLRWWLELAASHRACPWKFQFHGEIFLCWQTVLMRHNGGIKLLIPDGAFSQNCYFQFYLVFIEAAEDLKPSFQGFFFFFCFGLNTAASEETVTPQKYKVPTRINKVTRIISEANRGYCERVYTFFFSSFLLKTKNPFRVHLQLSSGFLHFL